MLNYFNVQFDQSKLQQVRILIRQGQKGISFLRWCLSFDFNLHVCVFICRLTYVIRQLQHSVLLHLFVTSSLLKICIAALVLWNEVLCSFQYCILNCICYCNIGLVLHCLFPSYRWFSFRRLTQTGRPPVMSPTL